MSNPSATDSNAGREFIAFRLGQQEFCVEVMKVREIRGWTAPTPIPHAPRAMLGVINLRGLILPIIDLADRVGFQPANATQRHVIVVVEVGEQVFGLLVDAVSEIFSVAAAQIQQTPDVASEAAKRLVHGVISAEGRMISIIALDEVTTLEGAIAA